MESPTVSRDSLFANPFKRSLDAADPAPPYQARLMIRLTLIGSYEALFSQSVVPP